MSGYGCEAVHQHRSLIRTGLAREFPISRPAISQQVGRCTCGDLSTCSGAVEVRMPTMKRADHSVLTEALRHRVLEGPGQREPRAAQILLKRGHAT